jgi:hypothetical protein
MGYLGQYLVIVPETNLVAVRMRRQAPESPTEIAARDFADFVEIVDQLDVIR